MTTFMNLVSVDELAELIEASACRVVDCRFDLMQPDKGRNDYAAGHIPGAVYADLDRDLASEITEHSGRHPLPDIPVFQALLSSWGIKKDSQLVVYDDANGATAARLWWMMRWVGHENVAVLDGGVSAWQAAGRSLSIEIPEPEPIVFNVRPNVDMIATTDEILDAIRSQQAQCLIDARARPRFEGKTEPIDTVAGHIPGAANLPFLETVRADGAWFGLPELSRVWLEALGNHSEGPVIAMCGSGVTACHIILTAHLLELTPPRLYVGSWSEWIRDESRPVVTSN